MRPSTGSDSSLIAVYLPFDGGNIKFLSTLLPIYTFMHAIPSTSSVIPSIFLGKLFLIHYTLPGYHLYNIIDPLRWK